MAHGKDFNELGQIYSGELVVESTEEVVSEESNEEKESKKAAAQSHARAVADHYEDDDKQEETVEEECEDEEVKEESDETIEEEDVVEEEDDDTLEEGLRDRIGATASAVKGASRDWMGGVMDAMKGQAKQSKRDPKSKFEDTKRQRIFESHLSKIKTDLSSFVTDLVKLKLMDETEAEAFAKGVYDQVANTFTQANKNRALRGRKFRD